MKALSGFRDFIHQDAQLRLKMIQTIVQVYQSFGFLPLQTPAIEHLSWLEGKGGEENERLIFKILKRGEKLKQALETQPEAISEYGLRFDLTLPLARVVSNYRHEIQFPWKVFQVGPVWRAERPQKGRWREFIQCDVDIIGVEEWSAELELIQAMSTVLSELRIFGFELRVNDRRLIDAFAQFLKLAPDQAKQFAILLDKKDKLSQEEFYLKMEVLLGQKVSSGLSFLMERKLSLEDMKKFHEEATSGLIRFMEMLNTLELPLEKIVFDPLLVRGMHYYTGLIFELVHPSASYSFGGGGRYDQLIRPMQGPSMPACGFSLGFERLISLYHPPHDSMNVFMPVLLEKMRGVILQLAHQFRKERFSVEVYSGEASLKNQLKYASQKGFRWVLLVGEEEWKKGKFQLKDFKTHEMLFISKENWMEALKMKMQTSAGERSF